MGFYLKEKKPKVKVVLADPQVILKMFLRLYIFVSYCIVWSSALSGHEICAVRYYKTDFIPTYHQLLESTKTKHLPYNAVIIIIIIISSGKLSIISLIKAFSGKEVRDSRLMEPSAGPS